MKPNYLFFFLFLFLATSLKSQDNTTLLTSTWQPREGQMTQVNFFPYHTYKETYDVTGKLIEKVSMMNQKEYIQTKISYQGDLKISEKIRDGKSDLIMIKNYIINRYISFTVISIFNFHNLTANTAIYIMFKF